MKYIAVVLAKIYKLLLNQNMIIMMKRIEHIGIAVANKVDAEKVFEKLLGKDAYKEELVESEGVNTVFFELGGSKLELLEARSDSSAIAKYLEKRGQGMHHIAIAVDDIRVEMLRLKSEGFILLNDEPKQGADNQMICFLHPKSTAGVLVELCESQK